MSPRRSGHLCRRHFVLQSRRQARVRRRIRETVTATGVAWWTCRFLLSFARLIGAMMAIVLQILTSASPTLPMQSHESVRAFAGRGLDGDRYYLGVGTF